MSITIFPLDQYVKMGWTEAGLIAEGIDRRTLIRIEGGDLFENVTAMANVLIEKNVVFFCNRRLGRTDTLRRVSPTIKDAMNWVPATSAYLSRELMKYFRFEKSGGRLVHWKPADCPTKYTALLVREAGMFFPHTDIQTLWEKYPEYLP